MEDLIKRQVAIDALTLENLTRNLDSVQDGDFRRCRREAQRVIASLSSAQQWISCEEKLPEDIKPVLVTWKNKTPEECYHPILNKPYTAVAHYCNSKWYWYSNTCEDMLARYGKNLIDEVEEPVEIIAWQKMLEPYREEQDG